MSKLEVATFSSFVTLSFPPCVFRLFCVDLFVLFRAQEEKNKKIFSFIGGEKWAKKRKSLGR